MSDNGAEERKELDLIYPQSVQERVRGDREITGGFNLFTFLSAGYGLVSPWWSAKRDYDLDRFWKRSPHLSGAYYTLASKLTSVPFRIEARDPSVSSHRKLADKYQERLEADWIANWTRALLDRWTYDNGLFMEIVGDGRKDGPIVGMPEGLVHLDSARCTRTGNAEYPVIYTDTDGVRYQLHRSRVVYSAEMPSPRAEMYGVGYCWTSRVLDVAQNLVDILTYKEEKLGSRPARMLGITRGGLDPDDVQSAFDQAAHAMDSQMLSRFAKYVFAGNEHAPDAEIQFIDLASLPDGFDENTSVTLGMFTIALTGAVPPRWLWPATVTGATKADAMYQHVAGLTGGPGATLKMIATLLGGPERGYMHRTGKFLPTSLRMIFDVQDDEQDRTAAEIASTRAKAREMDLNSGVLTVRISREIMVEDGEITEAQFAEMELEDGRLADGNDVLTLFDSPEPFFRDILDLGVPEPLAVAANDADTVLAAIEEAALDAMAVAANPANAAEQNMARQALAALEKLKGLYTAQQLPVPGEEEVPPGETETPPPEEDGGETQANFEKSFKDALKVSVFNGATHFKEPCWMCHRFVRKGRGKLLYDNDHFSVVCAEHETELPIVRYV